MKKSILKFFVFFSAVLFLSLLYIDIFSFSNGYVGVTNKGGEGIGCVCHGTNIPTPSVSVFFEGPDSVAVSKTVLYKIKISHGPAIVGGFDAAVYSGIIDTVAADTTLRRDNPSGDLTHRFPKEFNNDTLYWTFKYTAPGSELTDTLYAVGNSCNNDTTSSSDEWNFSPNFLIRVYNPIGIANNGKIVKDFKLYQNYPNPFNPVTKIKYDVKENGNLKISVFDVNGRFISILKDGFSKPGTYEEEFDGNNLSSGIYFYKIETGSYSDTKAMVLIK